MQLDADLPRSNNHILVVVLVLLTFIVLLYFFNLYLTPAENEKASSHALLVKSILENTMGGVIAALALALTYRSIIRFVEPGDRVIEVAPRTISSRLQENARRAGNYTFIGNTATFVAASILPILCARAQSTGHTVAARIFVIDPRDAEVIAAYIRHKSRVGIAKSRIADADMAAWIRPTFDAMPESADEAMAKLYACIYLCAYASKSAGVEISVLLRRSFTPFRADVSDKEVILTQESAGEAAVAFSARGHFYGWYDKEAEALEQQCTRVSLTTDEKVERTVLAHPSSARERIESSFDRLFNDAFADLNFKVSPEVRSAAIDRIIRPSHSYMT